MALKLEFLRVDEQGSWSAMDLADRIYDGLRSYRNDRCAIFIDPDSAQGLLRQSGLQADFLDSGEHALDGVAKTNAPEAEAEACLPRDGVDSAFLNIACPITVPA